jgi:hypothetical protein
MKISFDIPLAVEQALNLNIQRSVRPANVDGQTVLVPMFPTVEAFFESVLSQVFDGLLRQYRPEAIAVKLEQIEALEQDVRNAGKVQISRAKP